MKQNPIILFKILLIVCLLYTPQLMAQSNDKWYIITDKGTEIPLTDHITLQSQSKRKRTFSIFRTIGYNIELVEENVRKITFIKRESTGISSTIPKAEKFQLAIEENMLYVKGLTSQENISIFSLDGIKWIESRSDMQGTIQVNISQIPQGTYILKNKNTNIQFIKK